jgi:hypothetical protein
MGIGVEVGVQLGSQPGVDVAVLVGRGVVEVGVGEPTARLVKIVSITPLTILTVTVPCSVSLLIVRSGLTSIRET